MLLGDSDGVEALKEALILRFSFILSILFYFCKKYPDCSNSIITRTCRWVSFSGVLAIFKLGHIELRVRVWNLFRVSCGSRTDFNLVIVK